MQTAGPGPVAEEKLKLPLLQKLMAPDGAQTNVEETKKLIASVGTQKMSR